MKGKDGENEQDSLGMAARNTASTEVLDGFSGLGASEQDAVGASGRTESKLIESDGLAASLENASASSLGEAKGAHGQLRHLHEAGVVCDCADNNHCLSLNALEIASNASNGHGRAVDLGHVKSLQNLSIESRVCSSLQEAVKLRPNRLRLSPTKNSTQSNTP